MDNRRGVMNLWPLFLPVLVGLLALYLLLPRARSYPALWGAAAAALAILLAGWFLIERIGKPVETVLFYIFSGIAIVAGGLLITQRNPARAALSFALVILSTCGLFLLQAAPFLMAATIIIYTGAIIVTFLFVLMLAQQSGVSDADQRSREPFLSALAGFILLGALLYVLSRNYDTRRLDALIARADRASEASSVEEIERTLGNDDKDSFFSAFAREVKKARGSRDRAALEEDLDKRVKEDWKEWKEANRVAEMRAELTRLVKLGTEVRNSTGILSATGPGPARSEYSTPLPGTTENVAPLGRALFTDYLLPVELGGTLLLVAAIGAIAIAGRRPEGAR